MFSIKRHKSTASKEDELIISMVANHLSFDQKHCSHWFEVGRAQKEEEDGDV